MSEITSADVFAVLEPIWTSKAEAAKRVRQRIGTVGLIKAMRISVCENNVGRRLTARRQSCLR